MPPRRSHRKSKRGCAECKRRHIKCDETHPFCVNCTTSNRTCKWDFDVSSLTTRSGQTTAQSSPTARQTSASDISLTPGVSTASHVSGGSPLPVISQGLPDTVQGFPDTFVNVDHLELLHHFYVSTCRTLVRTRDQVEMYRKLVISQGIANPFLIYQTLAFSAIHLGFCRPERREHYRSMATSLQSKALSGLNEVLVRVDATSCLAVTVFSHMVGLHVFHEIFTVVKDDFNTFMDGLVGCVRLLRGVNLVIRTWRDVLLESELGAIMKDAEEIRLSLNVSHDECSPLRELVETADLSPCSKAACAESLDKLQECFNFENVYPGDPLATTNVIFAWFVTASSHYIDLVDQRRPEALILFAYYSVLLHQRRKSWVVGDAGQRLFKSIKAHLGRRWETWLIWPQNAIASSSNTNTPASTS